MATVNGTIFIYSIILYASAIGLLITKIGIGYDEWINAGNEGTMLDYLIRKTIPSES